MSHNQTVCVIGAGVTGLYLAYRLGKLGYEVSVYERSKRLGGRWKTLGQNGHDLSEAGAWRVSGKHHNTLRLLKELKVQTTPIVYQHEQLVCVPQPSTVPTAPCEARSGLSVRDNRMLQTSVRDADLSDRRTGYPGQDKGSCSVKEVYGALATETDTSSHKESGKYFYLNIGFQETACRLLLACKATGRVRFYMQHVVKGSTRDRAVHGCKRTGSEGVAYEPFQTEGHDWLVWCVPPRCLPVDHYTNFHLLRSSTIVSPLVHVYVRLPDAVRVPTFKIRSGTPLCQSIHHRPTSGWWQPAYASGAFAQFWQRLYLHHPNKFVRKLKEYLQQVLQASKCLSAREIQALMGTVRADDDNIRVCYWDQAIHMWEPVWYGNETERMHMAVCPNPSRRPRVLVAGEAFSLHQGWTEGCLQTANIVVDHIVQVKTPRFLIPRGLKARMTYRGMVFRVPQAWAKKHPGGEQAVSKYYGKDVTMLWEATHKDSRKANQQLFAFLAASYTS